MAEALKLIFQQPDYRTAQLYLEHLAKAMQNRWPKAAEMLWEAKEDILVYKSLLHKPIDSRFTHKFSKIIKVQTKTT